MRDFLYRRVRDAMTRDVVTIGPGALLSEVATIFDANDFNALPVVEDGRLVGLVTKLDLLRGFVFTPASVIPHYDEIMAERASTVMSTNPQTFAPDDPLPRVLQRMVDTAFKSFPVVEDGRLAGIVAREDVVRALRSAGDGRKPGASS